MDRFQQSSLQSGLGKLGFTPESLPSESNKDFARTKFPSATVLSGCFDGRANRDLVNRRRAAVRLFVLSDIVNQRCYILKYENIKRVELNLPGKIVLFPVGMNANFGDWGYDELTSPQKGLFRHEILFSSGATISIDCREISVRRRRTK